MASIPGSISERPDMFVTGVPACSVLHKMQFIINRLDFRNYTHLDSWSHLALFIDSDIGWCFSSLLTCKAVSGMAVIPGLCWSEVLLSVLVSNGDGAILAITNKSCSPLFVAGIGLVILHVEKN